MDEWNVDGDDAPCACDECLTAWMDVLVAEVALDDAAAAVIAELEQQWR